MRVAACRQVGPKFLLLLSEFTVVMVVMVMVEIKIADVIVRRRFWESTSST